MIFYAVLILVDFESLDSKILHDQIFSASSLSPPPPPPPPPPVHVIQALQNQANCLHTLRLEVNTLYVRGKVDPQVDRLHLPCLKHLRLHIKTPAVCTEWSQLQLSAPQLQDCDLKNVSTDLVLFVLRNSHQTLSSFAFAFSFYILSFGNNDLHALSELLITNTCLHTLTINVGSKARLETKRVVDVVHQLPRLKVLCVPIQWNPTTSPFDLRSTLKQCPFLSTLVWTDEKSTALTQSLPLQQSMEPVVAMHLTCLDLRVRNSMSTYLSNVWHNLSVPNLKHVDYPEITDQDVTPLLCALVTSNCLSTVTLGLGIGTRCTPPPFSSSSSSSSSSLRIRSKRVFLDINVNVSHACTLVVMDWFSEATTIHLEGDIQGIVSVLERLHMEDVARQTNTRVAWMADPTVGVAPLPPSLSSSVHVRYKEWAFSGTFQRLPSMMRSPFCGTRFVFGKGNDISGLHETKRTPDTTHRREKKNKDSDDDDEVTDTEDENEHSSSSSLQQNLSRSIKNTKEKTKSEDDNRKTVPVFDWDMEIEIE